MNHEALIDQSPTAGGTGFFEKWLSIWVALCIVVGIVLGGAFSSFFSSLAALEYASVNLVVAVLIWAMVFPMMVNVDFASLRHIGDRPKGLIITLVVNWLIKPFTMAALGVLFFELVFADMIAPVDAQQYIAGLILLGAAPCTAMVFVLSQLTGGEATYILVQVSVNDAIMVIAFAPIVALLLGVTDLTVPWNTLLLSVGLYVVVPLIAGAVTRHRLLGGPRGGMSAVERFTSAVKPASVIGLLATVVLLFGFQGQVIIDRPFLILLITVPLLIPVLWHLLHRLRDRLGLACALQDRRPLRADWHVEFLRACGRRCGQPVRSELGARSLQRWLACWSRSRSCSRS